MRKLAAEKPELRVVNDQTGTPTWARSLAEVVAKICALTPSRRDLGKGAPVYHATCSGETTRFDWVRAIVDGLPGKKAKLTPVASTEFPSPARRPLYSVLSGAKLERDFGLRLPDWRAAFDACSREAGWR
jgi:dTDP-4-dehydrorhamnose reductase